MNRLKQISVKLVISLLWMMATAIVSVVAVVMTLALLTSILLCLPVALYIFLTGLFKPINNK